MLVAISLRGRTVLAFVLFLAMALTTHRAHAQFSAREGFTADGTAHWSFEISPYVFLPNSSTTIGLAHPAAADITINRSRPTIAQVVPKLTGAFVGYGLARYGNWSAELNIFYIGMEAKKFFPPVVPGGAGATLKSSVTTVFVSPGIGYRILPIDPASKYSLDVRAGFMYNYVEASANFEQSPLGGISKSYDFVQPWVGTRLSYYPSPKWRLTGDVALTGMGVDGGTIGWNGRLSVSYLITSWFDVTLGYAALQTVRHRSVGSDGSNRSINLLAYGPVAAVGFRF